MYNEPSLSTPDAGRFSAGKPTGRPAVERQQKLSAWQRWEMSSFTQEPAPGPTAAPAEPELQPLAPVLLMNEAELSRLRLEAQKAGEADGYEQGYGRGLADGQAAGLAAMRAQAGQLQALTLALPAALRAAEDMVADELLALALDIARQVFGQALAVDPQAILTVVHELLQAEPALSGAPQLLLHADDAALVKEHLGDELKGAGWRIRVDGHISRGGCRVLASGGERDATLETRWERVTASLARSTTPPRPAHDD